MSRHTTIAILPEGQAAAEAEGAACGGCLHSAQLAPGCRASQALPCAATELVGPQDELQRLLEALGRRLGFAPESPEQAGVLALRLAPGEVELQLALPARCLGQGAAQADTAFQTLRGLLPDTDIYVTHAG